MNRNLVEIIFLLDRSGSMGGLENDTIGGFNAFVENQTKQDGETRVTAVLFDDRYELLWNGIEATKVRLSDEEYYVRGTTALLDAVGKTITDVGHRLSETQEMDRPRKVIFVITTDGLENASSEYTQARVKSMISHQQLKYGWEFVFLGANMDAVEEAGSIGICRDSAFSFEATEAGVENMYKLACEAVCERRK